ncbi:MAG: MoaD/ThiS family protein [Deltaproteobacteria bacterium]|nr:MoaD/ThiS family protein [Deltaproteobacteria bacterium]
MGRLRVKYLNIYSMMAGKKEEVLNFEEQFTLKNLLERTSGSQRIKGYVLDREGKLKSHIWILVNRERVTDLEKVLKDGDTIVFSLPVMGG